MQYYHSTIGNIRFYTKIFIEIYRVFKQHHGNYGSPRIAQQLFDEGIQTNKRVVAVLMQRAGLVARGYRKRTSSYGKKKPIEQCVKENILQRGFHQETIDRIWVTDITYIPCRDGRIYLSTYIDLATRIPRCHRISTSMKQAIVLQPLQQYKGDLPSIIHSDPNRHKTKGEMNALIHNCINTYYIHDRIHTKFMMTPYQYQQQLL